MEPQKAITVTFHIPVNEFDDIHGGTWKARYDQASGVISKDEADRRVRESRAKRKARKNVSDPLPPLELPEE